MRKPSTSVVCQFAEQLHEVLCSVEHPYDCGFHCNFSQPDWKNHDDRRYWLDAAKYLIARAAQFDISFVSLKALTEELAKIKRYR